MRTQITNTLQQRYHAVKNAVEKSNKAAANLNLLKPAIEWSRVTQYEFIQDFTLLCDCNPELITKLWLDPLVRLTTIESNAHMKRSNSSTSKSGAYTQASSVKDDS